MDKLPKKPLIYQLLVRLFGNKHSTGKLHGSLEENGCGTFNDISPKALASLKQLGMTHIWYTGVIEHATMTDFSSHGIMKDAPEVVKGQAGSPYAIKDYYDVNPAFATNVENRMDEFEALIKRTHEAGLQVIIDFVPNHVARQYTSDAIPNGIKDLGSQDDPQQAFQAHNQFYYLPDQAFQAPAGYEPYGPEHPLTDRTYTEIPAKATGNDVFSASPSLYDWFETIKLNYGIDIAHDYTYHFDPIPATWSRMYEILSFWAEKGVDGFRCDMVHMVPTAFWNWLIPKLKLAYPSLLFIGEIYDPGRYREYLNEAHFDYLYDKVGVYDCLCRLLKGQDSTQNIRHALWQSDGLSDRMLRFMENHDEVRLASRFLAGDLWGNVPAMTVSACLSRGPVMLYFGQEYGEPAEGESGFSGDDGRTTIFDYWHVPEHQKWMNGGAFDGGGLSQDQHQLRKFFQQLFALCQSQEALYEGHFYELPPMPGDEAMQHQVYAFLRYTAAQRLLILVNFNRYQGWDVPIYIPGHAWECMDQDPFHRWYLKDVLADQPPSLLQGNTQIWLPHWGAKIFQLERDFV